MQSGTYFRKYMTITAIILLVAVSISGVSIAQETESAIPIVFDTPQFDVNVTTHTYAQGLSHDNWNSDTYELMDLELDLYEPVGAPENRPALVIVHGGGYIGGSRRQGSLTQAGQYFASRGWVAISIDYRLARDKGTVPTEWLAYIETHAPREQLDAALAIYPANRDARAAVRWLYANAEAYQVNTDYISTLGGSAGAGIAITLGTTDEAYFRDELSVEDDPSLMTTNLDQPSEVHAIIDLWGGAWGVDIITDIADVVAFDETDAPIMIVHGTRDRTVDFSEAERLRDKYEATGVPYAFYPLERAGHGAWNATVDGKNLTQLAYDFIIEQQALMIAN